MDSKGSDLKAPPPAPAFRLFTRESLTKIAKAIQEDKAALALAKEQEKERGGGSGGQSDEKKEEEKPKPNPQLEQGMSLPAKMGDFPPEMYGMPIEDIDEFYHNKYVSCFSVNCCLKSLQTF